MSRVVVVGAGLGGLAAALFTARRGHEVVVLERDPQLPPGQPEDDFSEWQRPGVPQARQPHRFLGLSYRVLAEEAPDVIEALLGRGVLRADLAVAGRGASPDDVLSSMCGRRLVYEAAVRRRRLACGRWRLSRGGAETGAPADSRGSGFFASS